jgi:hypothetical protein
MTGSSSEVEGLIAIDGSGRTRRPLFAILAALFLVAAGALICVQTASKNHANHLSFRAAWPGVTLTSSTPKGPRRDASPPQQKDKPPSAKFAQTAQKIKSVVGDRTLYPLDRPSVAPINNFEGDDKDDNRHWLYLNTSCMTRRQDFAAVEFERAHCTKVLEIGGYLKPLTASVDFIGGPGHIELYVNVDPSMLEAVAEERTGKAGKYSFVNAPMLLDEWVEVTMEEDGKLFGEVPEFDCILLLGSYWGHFDSNLKMWAWEKTIKGAKSVILESPQSVEYKGITLGEPSVLEAGFCLEDDTTFNCQHDPDALEAAGNPAAGTVSMQTLNRWYKHYEKCEA